MINILNISFSRIWTVCKEIFYYCWSLVSNYESHDFSKLGKLLSEYDQISLECQQQSNISIYNVKVATKICTLSSELYLCNKVQTAEYCVSLLYLLAFYAYFDLSSRDSILNSCASRRIFNNISVCRRSRWIITCHFWHRNNSRLGF